MTAMQRNDSSSVISSLQLYGESDEEENDSRNNSHTEIEPEVEDVTMMEDEVKMKSEQSFETEESLKPIIPKTEELLKPIIPETEEPLKPIIPKTEELVKPVIPKIEEPLKPIIPNPAPETEIKPELKEEPPESSPVDFISDDDDDDHNNSERKHRHHHHHHHHHHHRHHKHPTDMTGDIPTKEEAISEATAEDSPASQGSTKPERKATRLVSYGPDEDVEDEESSEDEDVNTQESNNNSPVLNSSDASILSRSVLNKSNEDIQIPPEPPGKCPYQLQKKIEDMYDKMRRDGLDLNRVIQNKKNFRNPSIYEKLIDFCHIDEKGTNFPMEVYDPHIWGKESFYDELDKSQRKDMEKREKEKKERTKIEFMTGTKKAATHTDGAPEEKKRKTKWDAQPGNIQVQYTKLPSANQNPGVANLTAIATGTKSTVIPAVGSLSKKSSSGK